MTSVIKNRVLTVLGFLGIFVTGELSLASAFNTVVPCGIAGGGCERVAQDPWSHFILGIPNAYLGLAAYLILTLLAVTRIYVGIYQEPRSITYGFGLTAIGVAYSLVLLYRMIFVIKAICPWCLTSDLILLVTLVFYFLLNRDMRKELKSGDTKTRNLVVDKTRFLAPALFVLTFGILLFAAYKMTPGSTSLPGMTNADFAPLEGPDAHVMFPQGKMTVIEFGDIVCPSCRQIYGKVHSVITTSKGRVRFIFHHFPLVMLAEHKDAFPGAIIAELCSEKGKFFQFLDAAYTLPPGSQNADQPPPMITLAQLESIAVGLGVNRAEIEQKVQNAKNASADHDPEFKTVLNDMELGQKFHVMGTPTYFILAPGVPPQEATVSNILEVLHRSDYKAYIGDQIN